jgi:hypothetical protein
MKNLIPSTRYRVGGGLFIGVGATKRANPGCLKNLRIFKGSIFSPKYFFLQKFETLG